MAALRIAGALLLALSLLAFVDAGQAVAVAAGAAEPGALAEPAGAGPGRPVIPQWMSLGAMVVSAMALVLGWPRD